MPSMFLSPKLEEKCSCARAAIGSEAFGDHEIAIVAVFARVDSTSLVFVLRTPGHRRTLTDAPDAPAGPTLSWQVGAVRARSLPPKSLMGLSGHEFLGS